MRVQHKYALNGLQLVGIAIENVTKVRDYEDKMGIGWVMTIRTLLTNCDYVLLIGNIETLGLGKSFGNRAGMLPLP